MALDDPAYILEFCLLGFFCNTSIRLVINGLDEVWQDVLGPIVLSPSRRSSTEISNPDITNEIMGDFWRKEIAKFNQLCYITPA